MPARLIRHAHVNRVCALLSGYGSRDLLTELGGNPIWLSRYRAWATIPRRARDAVALAESRGWPVENVEPEHLLMLAGAQLAEERGVLW